MISLWTFLFFLSLSIGALLPIVWWGYVFSYISGNHLAPKKFTSGLFAGACSALIIFGIDRLISGDFSVFKPVLLHTFDWQYLGGLLGGGFLLLLGSTLNIAAFSRKAKEALLLLGKIAIAVGIFALGVTLLRFGVTFLPEWSPKIPFEIRGLSQTSVFLAFAYYLSAGGIEELSKASFSSSWIADEDSQKQQYITAIFTALGFAFLENILYAQGQQSIVGSILFRSLFSTLLHVLAATIAIRGIIFLATSPLQKITKIAHALLIAGIVHAFFNAGTASGFTIVPLAYLLFGYLFLGKVFSQADTTADEPQYLANPDDLELAHNESQP